MGRQQGAAGDRCVVEAGEIGRRRYKGRWESQLEERRVKSPYRVVDSHTQTPPNRAPAGVTVTGPPESSSPRISSPTRTAPPRLCPGLLLPAAHGCIPHTSLRIPALPATHPLLLHHRLPTCERTDSRPFFRMTHVDFEMHAPRRDPLGLRSSAAPLYLSPASFPCVWFVHSVNRHPRSQKHALYQSRLEWDALARPTIFP